MGRSCLPARPEPKAKQTLGRSASLAPRQDGAESIQGLCLLLCLQLQDELPQRSSAWLAHRLEHSNCLWGLCQQLDP